MRWRRRAQTCGRALERDEPHLSAVRRLLGTTFSLIWAFCASSANLERNASLDTFELAGILVPHAGRYSLGALAAELGITLPATHRALDDARVAHQLYLKVFDRALELTQDVIDEITTMADRSGWQLADFWRDVKEAREQRYV